MSALRPTRAMQQGSQGFLSVIGLCEEPRLLWEGNSPICPSDACMVASFHEHLSNYHLWGCHLSSIIFVYLYLVQVSYEQETRNLWGYFTVLLPKLHHAVTNCVPHSRASLGAAQWGLISPVNTVPICIPFRRYIIEDLLKPHHPDLRAMDRAGRPGPRFDYGDTFPVQVPFPEHQR